MKSRHVETNTVRLQSVAHPHQKSSAWNVTSGRSWNQGRRLLRVQSSRNSKSGFHCEEAVHQHMSSQLCLDPTVFLCAIYFELISGSHHIVYCTGPEGSYPTAAPSDWSPTGAMLLRIATSPIGFFQDFVSLGSMYRMH